MLILFLVAGTAERRKEEKKTWRRQIALQLLVKQSIRVDCLHFHIQLEIVSENDEQKKWTVGNVSGQLSTLYNNSCAYRSVAVIMIVGRSVKRLSRFGRRKKDELKW